MTVSELISKLNMVEDKNMLVYYYDSEGREYVLLNRIELKTNIVYSTDEPINIIELI